ncbi:histidine phosphatase family protein [Spongiivirga citrea]|uniref:Phosphoglycerate mutase n=1 Tax=Spongiivirga citrea TaxID=1481457 RepID=A0A6M0CU37_9FLAO|nr:histidine phosphatase family protein [Spongiivirga citrea]NER19017.1 phosphoglycerate mutase [Spongiivirga citrea]
MKKVIIFILLFTASFYLQAQEDVATTYYFVRHAEKQVDGTRNPHLTEEGKARANKLGTMFKNEKIDVIYTTDYYRTKETASGIAVAMKMPEKLEPGSIFNITVKAYDPRDINLPQFLKETKGKRVVVVGHSNTTPNFVNSILGKKKYEQIDESVYGNVYIVTVIGDKAEATLFNID